MRKLTICTAAALGALSAFYAWADLGEVVGSFSKPELRLFGLTRSERYLYGLEYYSNCVFIMDPRNGSIYSSWPVRRTTMPRGIAYTPPSYIWVSCADTKYIYRCDGRNGSVYSSWRADLNYGPYGIAPQSKGDGGKGAAVLFSAGEAAQYERNCCRHNITTGSIVSFFRITKMETDIAWDHRNAVVWVWDMDMTVKGYRLSGSSVASFRVPHISPRGLAYYGEYIWVACAGNRVVYRIHCPAGIGIYPASVGRIKALFQ